MRDWTYFRPALWAIAIVRHYTLPVLGAITFWTLFINFMWAVKG